MLRVRQVRASQLLRVATTDRLQGAYRKAIRSNSCTEGSARTSLSPRGVMDTDAEVESIGSRRRRMGDLGYVIGVGAALVVGLFWIFLTIDRNARQKMLEKKFERACDSIEEMRKDLADIRGRDQA